MLHSLEPVLGCSAGIFAVLFCPGAERGKLRVVELLRIGVPDSCLVNPPPGPLVSAPVLTEIAGVVVDDGWFLS